MKELIQVPAPIRFADIDMAQIIHNGAYLHYLEHTRIVWFQKHFPQWDWSKLSTLVAKNELHYFAPVRWGQALDIKLFVKEIGNKSITLFYEAWSKEVKCLEAEVVLVCYDMLKQSSTAVPEEWKAIMT